MFAKKTGHAGILMGELPYLDRFFVIGSKAKSYLKDKAEDFEDLKQFDSEQKSRYIFNALNVLSEDDRFKRKLTYFADKSNFHDFGRKICSVHQTNTRITIKNLYLAFIHTYSSD